MVLTAGSVGLEMSAQVPTRAKGKRDERIIAVAAHIRTRLQKICSERLIVDMKDKESLNRPLRLKKGGE